jgi:hypothetical protein
LETTVSSSAKHAAAQPQAQNNAGGRAAHDAEVRLPKLTFPECSGDPLKWQPFWQCFSTAVDRQQIANVTKLTYLVQSLKDSAARAVEGYAVISDNYPIVVEVLKKRFGDTEVVAEALEAELINLPQSGDSISALRSTSEATERICRQFSQLGKDENSPLFITTAKSKLISLSLV